LVDFADVWNGSSWSTEPRIEGPLLDSVSCVAATMCTATGEIRDTRSKTEKTIGTLAARYT
jgi:hypothetical protein